MMSNYFDNQCEEDCEVLLCTMKLPQFTSNLDGEAFIVAFYLSISGLTKVAAAEC